MGYYAFVAVLVAAYLIFPDETAGGDTTRKFRLKELEREYRQSRIPIPDEILKQKEEAVGKRLELFDDYGHMRFGKRAEESDDYGHMRFGKRD